MITPTLRHCFHLDVELGPRMELGEGRGGVRRIIPIVGGTVSGGITGRVLDLGADWQTAHSPELAFLDTRYALETDDGAVIEVVNRGFRATSEEVGARLLAGEKVDPSEYYFRTSATLETGDERYAWVNARVFIGTGQRNRDSVAIDMFVVE